ncbi:MFS transporter [Curtobacterium sp. VKM Ac-1376]|nr:MFS transporter [Curtobacterium sp. VKM Ac-1376]
MADRHERAVPEALTPDQVPPTGSIRAGGTGIRRRTGWVRYGVLTFLSVGIAINYIDRTALSVAMPEIAKDFGLDSAATGVILSSFFWAYVVFMLPGGYLVDKIGPKFMLGLGSVIWGLSTIALGFTRGFMSLFIVRLVMGASEAPSYPGASRTVRDWFPKSERSFASGTFNVGSKVGATLAIPFVSILIGSIGWRGAFMVAGVLALLWGLGWWVAYRSPQHSKMLSDRELEHIEAGQEPETASDMKITGLLSQRTIQAMSVGFFCVNFVSYFFFTWFPTYMINTFHLSILSFGFIGTLPGIAAIIGGFVGGWVSDGMYRRGYSVTTARKVPLVVGMLGSTAIAFAAFSPSVWTAVTLLCVSNFAATGAASALWALPTDVAPSRAHVGTIGGIQNTVSNTAGIIGPIVIGFIMGFSGSFVIPLIVAGVVSLAGALTYAFWLPKIKPLEPRKPRSALV